MVQRPVLGLVLVLVLVRGQLEEDREGKAITVKKVRRKLAVPLGQCPEVRLTPSLSFQCLYNLEAGGDTCCASNPFGWH